ncbi:MAG: T9SS type A sorting domain-containing protein [Candidatus Electryoneaceae bacterium]|nr:T9SS type A sorting domain-containing protein [Candidatus Electryoneaceae bacterium]
MRFHHVSAISLMVMFCLWGTVAFAMPEEMSLHPPRLPAKVISDQTVNHSANDAVKPPWLTAGHRDAVTNILAIRVEFVRDTVSTTTGDGGFNYGYSDTMHFDPPPHDSLYFADHLQFLQFYWNEMSNGEIDLTWDIYPEGMQAAYQLPKQMWQYNYNYPTELDSMHLDRNLAELFRDAIDVADQDDAILWNEYDLVIIFHAGSGAEFDLGFTETPHDIPSAWMVEEDFELIGLDDGISVDDGNYFVQGGLILPETETHNDIQISMAGVICSLFGHTLGLPGLYDADDGQAVVGKWSLMDRGFGNYYGMIPSELDAWSRAYMGWIEPTDLTPGDWTVSPRNFIFPDTIADTIRAGRIRISESEYFLIECRNRDPELDSVAIAYDREGRRMVFKEDYKIDTLLTDAGFRVPVRIDNLDFDSPGSGILIWHVDKALYHLIGDKRFNSQNDRRGLDIEEADGAQDIGHDYAFLTPGYGTDYGIFEDAWYGDNEAHRNANIGYSVVFSDDTYPNSRSNSEAYTHVTIDRFSRRDTVMTFRYSRSFVQDGFPVDVPYGTGDQYAVGNYDDDPYDEIMVFSGDSEVLIIDGDGSISQRMQDSSYFWSSTWSALSSLESSPAVADINEDGRDDVIIFLNSRDHFWQIVALISNGSDYEFHAVDDIHLYTNPINYQSPIVIGGPADERKIFVSTIAFGHMAYSILDRNLSLVGDWITGDNNHEIFTIGSSESDTFLVIERYSVRDSSLVTERDSVSVFHDDERLLHTELDLSGGRVNVADFDASGEVDILVVHNTDNENPRIELYPDFLSNQLSVKETYPLPYAFIGEFFPADLDNDGQFELSGFDDYGNDDYDQTLYGLETNGVFVSGMNVPRDVHFMQWGVWELGRDSFVNLAGPRLSADLDGDGVLEYINVNSDTYSLDHSDYHLDCINKTGEHLPGFPMAIEQLEPLWESYQLAQLDEDQNLEFVHFTRNSLNVIEIPATNPSIWWGSQYRDRQNRNAVWETAQPFVASSSDPLMPEDLCYNWPNPARESTAIRYFLNFNADVKVDIFDITGQRITTLYGDGTAGMHHEIIWNTSVVARGGYLAVVEATGDSGTETKIIKIAVVK